MMKKFVLDNITCFNYYLLFIFLVMFVFSADLALAHRVVLFAWTEGDMVFTQSQFPDGRKIADGQVNVFDRDHNLLLEGKTDSNGEFSFKIPKIIDLNIVLDAGMGHQGQWNLSEDEIKSSVGIINQDPASERHENQPQTNQPETADTLQKSLSDQQTAADILKKTDPDIILNEKQLEQIVETAVEKALDKKLQPMNRMLAQMQNQGPSVNDIFGGIGYILGLMGVAAYFLSRKR